MSKIELDDEMIRAAFVQQIVDQLSEVKRDEIVRRAAEHVIRTDLRGFRSGDTDYHSHDLRQAITNMVVECMKERLETPENKALIKDACQMSIDKIAGQLAEKVSSAFTEATRRVLEGY